MADVEPIKTYSMLNIEDKTEMVEDKHGAFVYLHDHKARIDAEKARADAAEARAEYPLVSVNTVGETAYHNDAAAHQAVCAGMTKDDFIRWLLADRKRLMSDALKHALTAPHCGGRVVEEEET